MGLHRFNGLDFRTMFVFCPHTLLEQQKAESDIKAKLDELSNITEMTAKFHSFNDWMENQDNKYIKGHLLPAWKSFYVKYMSYQQKGILYTPDVYDFFLKSL